MKRIGLIALALVLSLGLMGAGLAYWNETLTISGTVATGDLDVEFTDVSSNDPSGSNDPGQTMDVAECIVTTDGPDGDGSSDPNDTGLDGITIDINNAYPCYSPVVSFTVKNCGSIPVKIAAITIGDTYSSFSGDIDNTNDVVDVNLGVDGTLPDTLYDLRITYTGVSEGDVLAVDGTVAGALTMHVWEFGTEGSDATENADGSFTITIDTIQFNG